MHRLQFDSTIPLSALKPDACRQGCHHLHNPSPGIQQGEHIAVSASRAPVGQDPRAAIHTGFLAPIHAVVAPIHAVISPIHYRILALALLSRRVVTAAPAGHSLSGPCVLAAGQHCGASGMDALPDRRSLMAMADPRPTAEERGGATATAGLDIPAMPPAGGYVSSNVDSLSTAVKNKMTTSASCDLSKQDFEALVRRLTMDELQTKRFVDEIVSKVTTEREYTCVQKCARLIGRVVVESPQMSPVTSSAQAVPIPRPALAKPRLNQSRAYQATVEDETASQADMTESFESGSRTQGSRESQSNVDSMFSNCSPLSSVVSESASSSKVSNMSSRKNSKTMHTPTESPQPSPKTRPTVRFSDRVPVVLHNGPSPPQPRRSEMNIGRQVDPEREDKASSLSAVDIKWGNLFDERGDPTQRLGQFLRGIANYIIAEYSPTNSMVVTPDKLLAFYSKYKLESEAVPFQNIFNVQPKEALDNLEDLYLDLRCNYCLVKSRPDSRSPPYIPALTPTGFAEWMTQQIQAFPDQEAKRLSQVIAELPIEADTSARDGKPERLPKQLSRHLLPEERRRGVHEDLVKAVNTWLKSSGYAKPTPNAQRKTSGDDTYRSSRNSVDMSERDDMDRYKSEKDHKSSRGSRSSRDSQDSYAKSSNRDQYRSEPSRHISRTNSEQLVRHPRDLSPPPVGSNHRVRSPASSNRYRSSVPNLSTTNDDYGLSPSSHHGFPSSYPGPGPQKGSSGERRNREQEYRYYQGREPLNAVENAPRSLGHGSKRQNLVVSAPPKEQGPTYEEYSRTSPRMIRNVGFDDAGSYHSGHSGGGA
ncbi:Fc.00g032160.m01.CDS01 [Cosmosporella sp. VM-42]